MSDKTYVPRTTPAPFVVFEPNPIIAADLCQSIGECPGGGQAIVVRNRRALEEELAWPGPRTGVLLAAETAEQRNAAEQLDPAIRVHGAAVIVMSGTMSAAEAQARGWHLLPLPFTPERVHAVIASLQGGRAAPGDAQP